MRDVDDEQIKYGIVVSDSIKVDDKVKGIVSEIVPENMIGNIDKYELPTISKD
ncbi:9886_t:CDS:1, partial [Racocetra persica]